MSQQELLQKVIEAEMANASAQMELQERLDAMNETERRLFLDGYVFRSQMIAALDQIFHSEGSDKK
jgi:hypothetical protein